MVNYNPETVSTDYDMCDRFCTYLFCSGWSKDMGHYRYLLFLLFLFRLSSFLSLSCPFPHSLIIWFPHMVSADNTPPPRRRGEGVIFPSRYVFYVSLCKRLASCFELLNIFPLNSGDEKLRFNVWCHWHLHCLMLLTLGSTSMRSPSKWWWTSTSWRTPRVSSSAWAANSPTTLLWTFTGRWLSDLGDRFIVHHYMFVFG